MPTAVSTALGRQDAMQRQSLVSISEFVALTSGVVAEADLKLLEVAAGTGRQHTFIKDLKDKPIQTTMKVTFGEPGRLGARGDRGPVGPTGPVSPFAPAGP